ncbi:hypothetical protein E7Z59_11675 [Robertkochia marina]|uniref:Uncharacterized protein n=1 Tax=Robertkochia marina TaxID=1227945 RepID=A0A4S3LY10_9FLAO|nr:hypothetical protein [Robertkochia marina]THD66459.1 hypothetical protein E7Z59_11675 [Robertkochia marina]
MERLQTPSPLSLTLRDRLNPEVLQSESRTLFKTLYGELGVNVKPMTFKTGFSRAKTERSKEIDSYKIRLKKLNAFGLTEVTDKCTMSLLAEMGYHTGKNGLSSQRRQRILDRIYFNNMPKSTKGNLLCKWGEFKPEERLRRMAETLTYLCMSREHQIDPESLVSVREMKEDLKYLKRMYYYPAYSYAWPSAASGVDAWIGKTIMVKSTEDVRAKSVGEAVVVLIKKILLLS